jgi:hypothetical protein
MRPPESESLKQQGDVTAASGDEANKNTDGSVSVATSDESKERLEAITCLFTTT